MAKVIFQATTYVQTAGLERGREKSQLANMDGVIDASNPKVTLNLHIVGNDDPECLFSMELTDAGVMFSAGTNLDVRIITGIDQEETLKVNIVKDGQPTLRSGFIRPGDLVMAMQEGNQQSEDGLTYVAAYGKE